MKQPPKQIDTALNQELYRQQKINQLLAHTCFLDDALNRAIFSNCTKKQKIEIVQTILRRILNKPGLIVVSVRYQKDLKELGAHSAVMDIVALDSDGQKYNIEFQMSRPLSFARLETYNTFMIKASLHSGQDYSELKHTWVIFITNQRHWTDTKEEIFDGEPVVLFEICKVIDDKNGRRIRSTHSHLYVVDALYDGNDPLGDLMRDLRCTDPDKIKMPALREVETLLKKKKKGRKIMTSVFKELLDEIVEEMVEEATEKEIAEAKAEAKAEVERVKADAKAETERVKADAKAETERVKAAAEQEVKDNTNQAIRNYFRMGGRDNEYIAGILGTSIEHIQKIYSQM